MKSPMTMTEKLLAKGAEKAEVKAGDNVWVNVDVFMTNDISGPGSIGIFQKEFGENAKVLLIFTFFADFIYVYLN